MPFGIVNRCEASSCTAPYAAPPWQAIAVNAPHLAPRATEATSRPAPRATSTERGGVYGAAAGLAGRAGWCVGRGAQGLRRPPREAYKVVKYEDTDNYMGIYIHNVR